MDGWIDGRAEKVPLAATISPLPKVSQPPLPTPTPTPLTSISPTTLPLSSTTPTLYLHRTIALRQQIISTTTTTSTTSTTSATSTIYNWSDKSTTTIHSTGYQMIRKDAMLKRGRGGWGGRGGEYFKEVKKKTHTHISRIRTIDSVKKKTLSLISCS